MIGKASTRLFLTTILTLAAGLAASASAQNAQSAGEILSTLPDSQAVMFVDTRRIFNEVLPRVIPQQQLDKMWADVQKNTASFDPRSVHFVALGVRYREPVSLQTPPDFVVVVKGSFNAEALLSLARIAMEGESARETYKGRSIDVFKIKKESKPAANGQGAQDSSKPEQPSSPPIPEVAATTFDANTLVFGVPAYVRAAVDAAEGGQGRIRADLVELVTRNPDNLVSLVGDVPASLGDFMKSAGMPQNEEMTRIVNSIRQLQVSVSMNAADFGAQTIIRTDAAENANGLNGLVSMGLSFARMGVEEELRKVPADKPREKETLQTVLNVISSIKNVAADKDVQIDLAVPQATVAAFVQKEMARRKEAEAKKGTGAKKPGRPGARRRGTRRRR